MADDRPPEFGPQSVPPTRRPGPDRFPITPAMPRPKADDLIGRCLGEYRIEARIGKGGMGDVFRGLARPA
jgi:hypothetical protein